MRHDKVKGYVGVAFISLIVCTFFLSTVGMVEAGDGEKLVNQLQSRDPAVREEAARRLGDLKDPTAVEPLIVVLKKDKDRNVRWIAEDALVSIGAPAVEPLIKMLNDDSWRVRRRAVRTLGKIRDARAIEPLTASMKMDNDCYVRKYAARAIGEINDPRAGEILTPALQNRNLEVIEGAYRFFIRRGEPGSEAALIESLNKNWNKTMAIDFLKCGNRQLEEAAAGCAKQRGYSMPYTVDWVVPKWGQAL
ncbi:MAG: HEAT repeat domain-containing protein [Thermodesulfobacteriota bacterium]